MGKWVVVWYIICSFVRYYDDNDDRYDDDDNDRHYDDSGDSDDDGHSDDNACHLSHPILLSVMSRRREE